MGPLPIPISRPGLFCLGGAPAPAEVTQDWQRLLALPDKPRQDLWEILAPSFGGVDAETERRAEAFCRLYSLAPADLRASLRVARCLLTHAAARDLPVEKLAEDMAALGAGDGQAAATLLTGYDAAKTVIRRAMTEEALFDHGQVLVRLGYRVDRIVASDHADGLETPVAVLTLYLKNGEREERTTFYATPETVRQLREACERIERLLPGAPVSSEEQTRKSEG